MGMQPVTPFHFAGKLGESNTGVTRSGGESYDGRARMVEARELAASHQSAHCPV